MSAKTLTASYTSNLLRGVDEEARTVDIVASTYDLDGYNRHLVQSGWDLERFKKNPVICLQHDTFGMSPSAGLMIANAIPETVRVEDGKLQMRVRFPKAGSFPLADTVFNLIAEGFLHSVSVGWNSEPEDIDQVQEDDGAGGKRLVSIYRKMELLEVSFVTVPANPNAIIQRAAMVGRSQEVDKIQQQAVRLEGYIKAGLTTPEAFAAKEAPAAPVLTASASRTFRIGETEIEVEVRSGDLAAFVAEFNKVVGYFDRKQPANRASTKVLARFYKKAGLEQPPEEVEAWEKMDEMITTQTTVEARPSAEVTDTVVQEVVAKVVEEVKTQEAPADTPAPAKEAEAAKEDAPAAEARAEPPAPEAPADAPPAAEEVPPLTPSDPTPTAAAAPPQPHASPAAAPPAKVVYISLSDLKALPQVLGDRVADRAAEALRQGMPVKDLDGFIGEESRKLLSSLIPS